MTMCTKASRLTLLSFMFVRKVIPCGRRTKMNHTSHDAWSLMESKGRLPNLWNSTRLINQFFVLVSVVHLSLFDSLPRPQRVVR